MTTPPIEPPDPPVYPPATISGFHVRYRYELLDRSDQLIDELYGVMENSGAHAESAAAQIHTSARLTIRDTGQVQDWTAVRVKPWVTVNGLEWPLGVFAPSIPQWVHTDDGKTAQVILADKTSLLARDYYGMTSTGVEAGANIVDSVAQIIASTGETNIAITPDDAVLAAGVEFEPNKSKLTSLNLLLDAGNFFSLWYDGNGQAQVTPDRAPQARGVRAHFVEGVDGIRLPDHGIYRPHFTSEQDLGKTPNVYQAVSATEGEEPALFAEAINTNPDDPLSVPNRGRVMPEGGPEFDVATSDQASLQAYAERKLTELALPSLILTIETPPRQIRFNDVVTFTSERHGIHGRFVVSNVAAPHTADADSFTWRLTLRKVVES